VGAHGCPFGNDRPFFKNSHGFVESAACRQQGSEPLQRQCFSGSRSEFTIQLYGFAQGRFSRDPVTGLKFQCPIETLAKRDGARRAHPLRLGKRGRDRLLDFIVTFITIQVILP
jgi:hypothetical protein